MYVMSECDVPSLQVRDLPLATYQKLVEAAKREHRSISQQAIVLLDQALRLSNPAERRQIILDQLSVKPILTPGATITPPEEWIRQDRDR
jgi:hypothetical protein